eukprot:TRINITY_DN8210_c0_g1_i1.p2 TRINITY_DN8210_c0_g1~~TRINITY_DN8210_c0_g1_i1.p2  ORF type:complete len:181 (-),score=12.74 TRINITY_DN8210_c0_g1_i1:582-1124(-)
MRGVAIAEGADVVFERPLVLEIGAARAEPELSAVLLVGSPVASHGEGLAALAAREGFGSVLSLVMRLQSPEILERPRTRMVDVVAAARRAAVARQPENRRRFGPSERVRTLPVLRAMPPHMHLHVVVAIEGLVADRARELRGTDEDLGGRGDPVLALREALFFVGTVVGAGDSITVLRGG